MTKEEAIICKIYLDDMDKHHTCNEYKLLMQLLEQEPCDDIISRSSIKHKLQEHHDFFVNAYGGFSNLPQNDKARVDEITNCIAMVVNEPSVNPQSKTGHWINVNKGKWNTIPAYKCSMCGAFADLRDWSGESPFCPWCGAKMVEPQERSEE